MIDFGFKVGDKVVFDYCVDKGHPRYDVDVEYDGPYTQVKGKVTHVDQRWVNVEYTSPNGPLESWSWPNPHDRYYRDMYGRPGYLRHVNSELELPTKRKCDCPLTLLMNRGCICGGE